MAVNKDAEKKPVEKKADVKVETKATKPRKPVVDDSPFCVYIGPSIRGMVRTNAIYEGSKEDVKKQLEVAIEKYPLIEKLISPSKAFVQDRLKVKTADNALGKYYEDLVRQLNEEVRTNG